MLSYIVLYCVALYSIVLYSIISYYIVLEYITSYYTSSTAQGGGGSFKNRKPIGEIDCCESPMTEQKHWWIELSNCVTD